MNTKALIAGAVCLVVGAGAGYFGASHQFSEEHEFCTEYSGFFDVYTEIKESYLKDISTLNKTRIEEEMVKGFVSGLDDRFSSYRTNEEEKTLKMPDGSVFKEGDYLSIDGSTAHPQPLAVVFPLSVTIRRK